jgi:predicted nucleic acid-binding Zn ribbon protein
LNAARVKEKQQKRDPEGGRCAPLAGIEAEGLLETWNEPAAPVARRAGFVPISATVKRLPRPAGCARTPALKSKIKSQLDMKHARYLAARGRPGEVGAYWEARLGEPEAAQRVFDEVDLRMRRSGWDDMREWKRQRGIAP